jgi:4-hydroxy-2-oxoheptanedioate aldolase
VSRFGSARGLWLTLLGADALEALPLAGVGWLGVDLQHGRLEVADLAGILRVSRVPVLARSASQDPGHLARVLDTGVDGVIVPGVGSGDEAAALVRAVRLPPEGGRSTGLSRSALVGGPERPLLLPMVETAEGLAAVERIASCPGVDGVFVGPYDLSLSLGRPSVVDDEVVAAIHHVARTARDRGVMAGAFAGNRELDGLLPELDLLAVDTDVTALRQGVSSLFG